MNKNVRLQNLRDFTVQIRRLDNNAIVGTGIAVSTDGKVVTCAHVVEAALGLHPRNANGAEVGVYFPQARGGEEKNRKAVIEKFFPKHDDDIVLLQLVGGASPLAPEQIAVPGYSDYSEGHQFLTYGFSAIEQFQAIRAIGMILGSVQTPTNVNFQVELIQLQSRQIDEGMSGAGVLDIERNLIIGLVSKRYYPDYAPIKDDISWAVDSNVLTFIPFKFDLRIDPLPLQPALSPKYDVAEAKAAIGPIEKHSWNNASPLLEEWTGREDLLQKITEAWNDPGKHVVGLIGFGGEGKSSLARKWVDNLLNDSSLVQPEGVFWWGFYENRNVDEFFEALLKWLTGGKKDPKSIPSSSAKAAFIAGMLTTANRYLFVLDGLEVLQYQEDDQFGLLQNSDLRDFITYLASPENPSFCLITSRTPLIDLIAYITYSQKYVEHLSVEDGRSLLRILNVKGEDDQLDKLVKDWDGHALTLSLLAGLLVDQYGGDIQHISDLPVPTSDEPRYDRVHRVLERYDKDLSEAEHAFLKLFSVFRLPVEEKSFSKVFRKKWEDNAINTPLVGLTDVEFYRIIGRLVDRRILRGDYYNNNYVFTAHPLIRNHYFALFTKDDPSQEKAAHSQIKDYYLSIAGDTPQFPTLDDLKPLIEVVHHACQAGAYDESFEIFWKSIQRGQGQNVLVYHLGAYETALTMIFEFFANYDTTQEPQVSNPQTKSWILNEVGLVLMGMGRLRDALPFYERGNAMDAELQEWGNASLGYQNLALIRAYLGSLEESAEAARQALDLARRAEDKRCEWLSLSCQGLSAHLRGDSTSAYSLFSHAENLVKKFETDIKYVYSSWGIFHADHLHKVKNLDYARSVTSNNLKLATRYHWVFIESQCRRILGDLDSDTGNQASARVHYESALKIALGISKRDVLIEALLGRGRFFAKHPSTLPLVSGQAQDANAAFSDLNEALSYCVESGYRIYEADVRVALAWAYLAVLTPNPSPKRRREILTKAKESAERALQMSNEMGYHWGKVDAEEVLERIEDRE